MKINALDKQTVTGDTVEAVEELTAEEANQFLHELHNLISSSGQSLSAAKLTQLSEAMARYASGGRSYKDDSTTAGYYQLSGQNNFKMPLSYQVGMVAEFVASSTNTGLATVNISGLGTKDIFDEAGNALVGGEIVDGHQISLFYSGTEFVLPNWSNALKLGSGNGVDFVSKQNGGNFEGDIRVKNNTVIDESDVSVVLENNKIVKRNGKGDIEGRYAFFNLLKSSSQISSELGYSPATFREDGYLFKRSPASFRSDISVYSQSEVDAMILDYRESGLLQLPSGSTSLSWNHLQSQKPAFFGVNLVCQTPVSNYNVGDELRIERLGYPYAIGTTIGVDLALFLFSEFNNALGWSNFKFKMWGIWA